MENNVINREKNTTTSETRVFDVMVDKVPYSIQSTPFLFNGETRFYISINSGEEHVFTWDSEVRMIRAIDDAAGVLPDSLEEAISRELQKNFNK
jgi:hypothetical protein